MRECRVASAKQNWKRDRLRGNRCGSLSIIIFTIRRATETASSGLNPAALIRSLKLSTNREKSMGMLSSGIFFSTAPPREEVTNFSLDSETPIRVFCYEWRHLLKSEYCDVQLLNNRFNLCRSSKS